MALLGSLRCHYDDGNENVKKRAFLYISLPSLHDYDVID